MSETKTCTKCKERKPLDDFPPRKTASDGRRSACKACRLAKDKKHSKVCEFCQKSFITHMPKQPCCSPTCARMLRTGFFDENGRTCTACLFYKPWDSFHQKIPGLNNKAQRCRDCCRGRKRGTRYAPGDREKLRIMAVQKGRCATCLELFSTSRPYALMRSPDTGGPSHLLCPDCQK